MLFRGSTAIDQIDVDSKSPTVCLIKHLTITNAGSFNGLEKVSSGAYAFYASVTAGAVGP